MVDDCGVESLICKRVEGNSLIEYCTMHMDEKEIVKRRSAIKSILVNTKYKDMNDKQIDSIRIEKTPMGYILEDEKCFETLLGYKLVDGDVEKGFRPLSEDEKTAIPFN